MSYALHRLAMRRFARAAARRAPAELIISGKMNFELAAEGSMTVDRAGDCEGPAPEGTSGASAAAVDIIPANVGPPHKVSRSRAGRTHAAAAAAAVPACDTAGGDEPPPPAAFSRAFLRERIALDGAPSGMESTAESWREAEIPPHGQTPAIDDGKAWCGPCDARVPKWFGHDCIAGACPLRVAA
jgi:hypothetical protein